MWRRLGTIFVLRNVRVLRGQILAERFRTWWRSGHGDRELFVCFVFFPLNLLEFEKNRSQVAAEDEETRVNRIDSFTLLSFLK